MNSQPAKLILELPFGEIGIELFADAAPQTCAYFAELARLGALDGSAFYRIVHPDNASFRMENPIEVVQGGLTSDAAQPLPAVPHESTSDTGLSHLQWTVSTAREAPGATYGSFFICLRDEPKLDFGGARHPDGQGFAAFGRVVDGHETVLGVVERRESSEFLASPVPITRVRLA